MNTEFWNGKRVFLTGHSGFKGAWLSLWLERLGAEVTGYALDPPTTPSLFELAGVADGLRSIRADVRDAPALARGLAESRPDVVFHLAAQSLVRRSYQHPTPTFDTNVMGTANVLEAVRLSPGVGAVVVVTSDKCYLNREWDWGYREDEPLGGYDPYSASKACAELVTASYRTSFFSAPGATAVASARAGNVIGGGDFARDRLITDIMAALRTGRPALIRNPGAIRPWQHVLEPLSGYLLLAEALCREGTEFARAWNFGPADTDARPVHWICDNLVDRWGGGAAWRADDGPHAHEATFLKLDSSLARNRLGWRPRLTLGAALDWIVEWNRALDAGTDVRRTTMEQIERYQGMAEAV